MQENISFQPSLSAPSDRMLGTFLSPAGHLPFTSRAPSIHLPSTFHSYPGPGIQHVDSFHAPSEPYPFAFCSSFIPFLDASISPPDAFYLPSLGSYKSFLDTFKPLPGLFNYPRTLPCTALPGLFHVLSAWTPSDPS